MEQVTIVHDEGEPKDSTWPQIIEKSLRVVELLDLPGLEKYIHTATSALCGLHVHYCLAVVDAKQGVTRMLKEHLGIANTLKIPIIVAVNKVDTVPRPDYEKTLSALKAILERSPISLRTLFLDKSIDPKALAKNFPFVTCPVFPITCVKPFGIETLKGFLRHLPVLPMNFEETMTRQKVKLSEDAISREVDTWVTVIEAYRSKPEEGMIVGATVLQGRVQEE